MCTHIIDFQDRKLKTFKGVKGTCLTQFVAPRRAFSPAISAAAEEKYPEKKAYFEISSSARGS